MASGIASPWGMTPPMVAGIDNSLDFGTHHLTGELNLSSVPPKFQNDTFISPLTFQNKSYYVSFGKKNGKDIKKKIKSANADIAYLK